MLRLTRRADNGVRSSEGPLSKKKSTSVVVDLPILTISSGSGLVLKKGGHLQAGGHFYATDLSGLFAKNDRSVPYVFVHVECDLTLESALTVGTGTSISVSKARVTDGGDVKILALVHPMYHTTTVGGAGYYLPKRTHIEAGETYPASNDDSSAPAISVKIELIPGGVAGKLTSQMSVIADTATHPGDAYIDLDT